MKRMLVLFFLLSVSAFAASTHGVLLSWTQSVTPGVTSNGLYCGTVSGTYPLFWNFSTPVTSFDWLTTDSSHVPSPGQKYFCIVTASVTGTESGPSNEVSFTFPQTTLPPSFLPPSPH
jgi:hypothetical protein